MNAMIKEIKWYANDAGKDKYVSCMSAMLEQIHSQGVTVACKWLEVTANLDIKSRWTMRRKYWLLTVRLFYAEWVGSEMHARQILDKVNKTKETLAENSYTLKMYQVLEAACYVSLYRITKSRVSPLFQTYHKRLLGIIDDLIELQLAESKTSKSLSEDCGRVYDVVADIEKICGSKLYQMPEKSDAEKTHGTSKQQTKAELIPFKAKEDDKIEDIITYLNQWLGDRYNAKKYPLMRLFLRSLEYAKEEVDRNIGLSTNVLFIRESNNSSRIKADIKLARRYMLYALNNKGITRDKYSFWKLYIDLVIQKAIAKMGKTKFNQLSSTLSNDMLLRQAARWPLHEKMHHVISLLASDPEYLENLLRKEIIHSESLLYGVFSTLAMKNIPVVYCGFNILQGDSHEPEFIRHCYNGRGIERIYTDLVKLVYKETKNRQNKGFCIQFKAETGLNLSLELACVCTSKQVVIIGIAKEFRLDPYYYKSSKGILGELFNLVGFKFIENKILTISGPNSPETAIKKLKRIHIEPALINIKTGFILNYIKYNSPPEKQKKYPDSIQKNRFNNDYFDEIIEVVRGV